MIKHPLSPHTCRAESRRQRNMLIWFYVVQMCDVLILDDISHAITFDRCNTIVPVLHFYMKKQHTISLYEI